jgi:hypothetical protein
MNQHTSKSLREPKPTPRPATGRRLLLVGLAVAALGMGLLLAILWPKGRAPTAEATAGDVNEDNTNRPGAASSRAGDFHKLVGRWQRPGEVYTVEVRTVDEGGRLQAAYYNPKPIRVSRAEASRAGGQTKVFLELSDVNYPGCTYTLTYDPQRDTLQGVYVQTALGESFDVVFVRMK